MATLRSSGESSKETRASTRAKSPSQRTTSGSLAVRVEEPATAKEMASRRVGVAWAVSPTTPGRPRARVGAGAGRGGGGGEGDGLQEVRLALGVIPDDDVEARAEQDRVVGVVPEVYEAQGAQVRGQPTSRRSSPASTTSPATSFRPRRFSTSPLTSTSPAWIRTFASPPLPTRSAALHAPPRRFVAC